MTIFDLPPLAGPARDSAILAHALAGDLELEWAELRVSDRLTLLVSADAVKLAGVRLNVSATVQQQLADTFDALLPTPKMLDLMWLARAGTLVPATMPITSTTDAMVKASAMIDGQLAALGSPAGVVLQQKSWCIGQSLLAHPGRALNYGFWVLPDNGTAWRGIATEAAVSLTAAQGRVIQGQGWAHNADHVDYSQECWLVARRCVLEGGDADLRAILSDASTASLVSHEGALTVLRQPGVAPMTAVRAPSRSSRRVWIGAIAGGAVGAAAGAAVQLRGKRPPLWGALVGLVTGALVGGLAAEAT